MSPCTAHTPPAAGTRRGRRLLLVLAVGPLVIAGCAARLEVREIGAGGAPPFYELRGHRLEPLRQQAQALCPGGYRVARSWQRARPAESGMGPVARGRMVAEDLLWPGVDDQAQLTIQCEQGLPVFEPRGLPGAAAGVAAAPLPVAATAPAAGPEPAREAAVAGPSSAASAAPTPLPRLALPPMPAPAPKPGSRAGKAGAGKPEETRPRSGAAAASPFSVPAARSGPGAM